MSDIEKIRCKNPRCRGRWIAEVRYVGTMGFPVPLRWNGKPRRFNAVLHVYGPKARLPATKPLVAGHASPRNVTEEAAWVEAGASAIWVNADGEPVTFHGDQGEEGILVRADPRRTRRAAPIPRQVRDGQHDGIPLPQVRRMDDGGLAPALASAIVRNASSMAGGTGCHHSRGWSLADAGGTGPPPRGWPLAGNRKSQRAILTAPAQRPLRRTEVLGQHHRPQRWYHAGTVRPVPPASTTGGTGSTLSASPTPPRSSASPPPKPPARRTSPSWRCARRRLAVGRRRSASCPCDERGH